MATVPRRTSAARLTLLTLGAALLWGAITSAVSVHVFAMPGTRSISDGQVDMGAVDFCLLRSAPMAEAAAACERATKHPSALDPALRAALLHRRGEIAVAVGELEAALPLLEAARQLEPKIAPYALTLGDALLQVGQVRQAARVYREGQLLAPRSGIFAKRLHDIVEANEAKLSARISPNFGSDK